MKNPISEFFANPLNVMMAFILMLFVIKEAVDLLKWYKGRVDEYRTKENKKDKFEERVDALENGMVEIKESIKVLTDDVGRLKDDIDNYESGRKSYFVAQSRATLFQLYEDFKDKEELTLSEYETFNNLADKYLEGGGNGVFRHKIIPEIRDKRVTDN